MKKPQVVELKTNKARDARQKARAVVGPVPPSKPITPRKLKPPKHKKPPQDEENAV
jgi:hypothetical protein